MDHKEEQEGEVETLKAIYTEDEFNVITDDPWNFEVTVKSEVDDTTLQCVVSFSLPDTYPEVAPVISFANTGLLTSDQQSILLDALNEEAQANLEMPMVFTLVSVAQDKLTELCQLIMEEMERIKEEDERKKLLVEEAKYKGTPVNAETFNVWQEQFMIETNAQNKFKDVGNQNKGLTGRQMFEKDATLIMSDSRFLNELDETEDIKKDVEIDESLFQDLGDLDEELN